MEREGASRAAAVVVRADFDRIAELAPRGCVDGVTRRLVDRVLSAAPRRVLDVGSGTGALARHLAGRALEVIGIDLSPQMVRRARALTDAPNVRFEVADAMAWEPTGRFDLVTAVSSLHHVPLEAGLERVSHWVRPGGALVVHDLVRSASVPEWLLDATALGVGAVRRVTAGPRDRALAEAFADHSEHDVYPTMGEVRAACARVLPGARVRRRLEWRYTIVWRSREE